MVPLEAEQPTPDGQQAAAASEAGAALASVSAPAAAKETTPTASPLEVLSSLSFKDAIFELGAAARKSFDVSAAGVLQLWQVAERRLGVEVDIDDPALRGLFGLHVLAVEDLCNRVRMHADSMLEVCDIWNQPTLDATAMDLRLLADAECGDGSVVGTALASDLMDAHRSAMDARARLMLRIQNEICEPIDQRLAVHDEIREAVRDRQRWNNYAIAARRDVAGWRKEGSTVTGLRKLSGGTTTPLDEAETRLREASENIASIDATLLEKLTTLSGQSVEAVRTPWAALVQIQSEFYLAQQALWHPLSDAFAEFADFVPNRN